MKTLKYLILIYLIGLLSAMSFASNTCCENVNVNTSWTEDCCLVIDVTAASCSMTEPFMISISRNFEFQIPPVESHTFSSTFASHTFCAEPFSDYIAWEVNVFYPQGVCSYGQSYLLSDCSETTSGSYTN